MGYIIRISSLTIDSMNKLMTPIIFCVNKKKVLSITKGYNILSINEVLAKKLINYEQKKRKLFVIEEINNIVDSVGEPLLITDFEILFNPEFQINVLKLFINASRRKKILILWPGMYDNGKLKFAEVGYKDYFSYNIEDYDISCII
ncbi:BREX-3 system P-loop-containing protein BrxF [Bacillus sp. JJ1562]|uniref:BREX-3 system P-loop-containing protein BrxF n=1 Tax=Bacillus sp. JJ1562 TaxID=3122960 RepID=UPI003001F9D4